MNHRPLLLATAALLCAASASAQQARIDARLRFQARFGAPPAVAAVPAPLDARAVLRAPALDVSAAEVRAVVRLGPGGRAALERHGARIGAVAGDVVTATMPLAALDALALEPGVLFLEAAAWMDVPPPPAASTAARDTAATWDTGLDILRQPTAAGFDGAAGAGVIIGIYDSGLDLLHDDFRDAHGDTRVLYAWDQTVEGAPPGAVGESQLDYGYECTAVLIDAGGCPMVDRNGHGTHVTGIAAGDGSATGNGMPAGRFVGAAPAADLIVVKGGDAGYTSDRLLDGVAYIFARAAELGRPAVVNLSVGTQTGPHDGSTAFERGLENLLGDGRVIVTAAGNQGNNENEAPAFVRQSLHAMGTASGDAAQVHELVVPEYVARPGAVNDAAVIELWYDGADELTVGVRAPSGALVARLAPGDSVIAMSAEGAVYIDNAALGADPNNGDRLALISIFDADETAPPAPGAWRVEVERTGGSGTGEYHLWLVGSNLSTPLALPTLRLGTTNTHLVSLPGTAGRLITVGAHVTRHAWLGPNRAPQAYPFQEPLGELAHFSSPGPRRDGVLKPDLTAPGKVIVAARSRDATLWSQLPSFIDADGVHAVLFGTSMAAPYVAGTVALLLEFAPALTPEDARALLAEAARQDAFTSRTYSQLPGGEPNVHWGAGKLAADRAIHALPLPAGGFVAALDVPALPAQVDARPGTRIPVLRLRIRPDSVEAVHIDTLALGLDGDAEGELLVIADLDADGAMDEDEPVVARAAVSFDQPAIDVGTRGVAHRDTTTQFLVAVELAEGTRHGARFGVSLDPLSSRFVGTLSGSDNAWTEAPPSVSAPLLAVTALVPGQRWSLSENPVRSDRVVLSFEEPAENVRVYTLTGQLVRTLPVEDAVQVEWWLDNEDGALVASGVYLLLVEFADTRITRKLMVMRPGS